MEQLELIADLMLEKVYEQLGEKGINLEVDKEAKAILYKEGYDPTFGARPLRRAIQRLIENPLADELLKGQFKQGDKVKAVAVEGRIQFVKT
jgi:ATP-dependent Clp protease ATP-binding subunit ClpC